MVSPYKKMLMVVMLLSGATATSATEQKTITFETLFPNSPYTSVYRRCIDIWHRIRSVSAKVVNDKEWCSSLIDDLINLHSHVGIMIEKSSCSPNDLEHLMGVLHEMHVEYASLRHQGVQQEFVCCAVLFYTIEKKLEKVLL